MDTAARLLRLLSLLQARPHWESADLADRLGVTTRTVRRDVARLRSLGYPVEADAGHGGGYHLGRGGRLPPLLLDDDEAVAIAVGLRVATTTTVSGVEEAAVAALAKLHQVLPTRLRERVSAIAGSTIQLPRGDLPPVDAEVLVVLAAGCRRTEGLRFVYRDHAGRESRRWVEPFHIVHTGRRWYLVARDREREAWRTFRVDRIADPTLTGQRYHFDSPPDPVALVAEGTGVVPWEIKARVLISASAEEVARVVPAGDGVVEVVDERSCVLRFGANDLAPLISYTSRIPCDFDVLEPPELREAIHNLGKRLLRGSSPSPDRPVP
ncbi:helix-turn-helix transcriptional regulator [Kribbella deserti]|uniref:Helix-turn-helix transcriptional regulator n=1 Tax=Kribbella deserti TaxID=1926257 RepID=A0ABV6QKE7_9ACTN